MDRIILTISYEPYHKTLKTALEAIQMDNMVWVFLKQNQFPGKHFDLIQSARYSCNFMSPGSGNPIFSKSVFNSSCVGTHFLSIYFDLINSFRSFDDAFGSSF